MKLWEIVRHPIRALGVLMFLAVLEGAFGSPSGARTMLVWIVRALTFAFLVAVVAAGVLLSLNGYGVQLWIGLGALVLGLWVARHLRWQDNG